MLAGILVQLASQNLDAVWQDPALKGAIVGACVLDSSGKELYAHNADLLMVPASNQKLVTGAAALAILGPDYRPITRFWKLKDKIVVDSTGDPLLTHDDLLNIRAQLKIGKARNVEIHASYGPLLPAGWEWDDLPNKYAAPVSAFTVDRSSFELWCDGGKLEFLPESYGAKAIYHGGTGPLRHTFDPQTMTADVFGTLPEGKVRLDTLALRDPDFAAAKILGKNPRRVDNIPAEQPDLTWSGKPLSEILEDELPSSDNNVSENLMLIAAGVDSSDISPYRSAQTKMMDFLTSTVGLKETEVRVADGSGLSRHNVITARSLAKLLAWADQQPTKDLWHSCLARPNEEGTLKDRLVGVPFEGKTGTMDKVSALSGYLHLNDGRELVVAIVVNDYVCSTAQTRDLIDQFLKNVQAAGNGGTLFAESYNHAGTRPNARIGRTSFHRVR